MLDDKEIIMMGETSKNYFQSLCEAAAAVTSAHNPESVLLSIVEKVSSVMGAKGCSLMLLTWDRRLLLHAVSCGLSDSYIKKSLVSTDKSISEALEGKPVVVFDATQDERIQYPEAARKEGIVSVLSVPVVLRDKAIGVIRVYTAKPRRFADDDIDFVRAVANLGAIALENAKRYESLQEEYEQFRRRTFWGGDPFLAMPHNSPRG